MYALGRFQCQYIKSLFRLYTRQHNSISIREYFTNATSSIVLAGHPGYLLNDTFRDPTSDALQRFTNIATIIGDKEYSVIYYSPAETYPIYNTIYLQMIKSFEVIPQHKPYRECLVEYIKKEFLSSSVSESEIIIPWCKIF
jgi:hypothetical protein